MRYLGYFLALSLSGCFSSSVYSDGALLGSTVVSRSPYPVANGESLAWVEINLRNGPRRIVGVSPTVTIDNGTLVQAPAPTDGNGFTVAAVTTRAAGLRVVTASVVLEGLVIPVGNANVTFIPTLNSPQAVAGSPIGLQISLDANYTGNLVLASSDTHAELPTTQRFTAADGGYRFIESSVTFFEAGSQLLTGHDAQSAEELFSLTVQVSAGQAAGFEITSANTSIRAGTPLDLHVQAVDAWDNPVSSYSGSLTVSALQPQGIVPDSFSVDTFNMGATNVIVLLTQAGVSAVSVLDSNQSLSTRTPWLIDVVPAAATQTTIRLDSIYTAQVPSTLKVGFADAYNNSTDTTLDPVIYLSSSDSGANLPPVIDTTGSQGGLTVPVTFVTPGAQQVFVSSASLAGATQGTMVGLGPAFGSYLVSLSTNHAAAGAPLTLSATALDTTGQAMPSYAGGGILTSTDPNMAPLSVAFTPAAGGTVQVPITLTTAGLQTVSLTPAGSSVSYGAPVTFTPASLSTLSLTVYPYASPWIADQAADLFIQAFDRYGNLKTDYQGSVTFSSSDPQATVPATTSFPAHAGGVFLSAGWTLRTAGSQTLSATDTSAQVAVTSAAFQVVAATPAKLVVQTDARDTTPCVVMSPNVVVQVVDPYGNLTPTNGTVDVALANLPKGTQLYGTTQLNLVDGIATFSDLRVSGPAAATYLNFKSPGLVSAHGAAFDVRPLPPSVTLGAPSVQNLSVALTYDVRSDCPVNVAFRYNSSNANNQYMTARYDLPQKQGQLPLGSYVNAPYAWDAGRDMAGINDTNVTITALVTNSSGQSKVTTPAFAITAGVGFVPGAVQGAADVACVVTADFDGDRLDDVAYCDPTLGFLRIALSSRSSFVTGTSLATTHPILTAAAGDINNDGKMDLVGVDSSTGTVYTWLNAGGGTFAAASSSAMSIVGSAVRLADFDQDGTLDVIVAGTSPGPGVGWARGNGAGFANPQQVATGAGAADLALGDLNRDGTVDVAVAASSANAVAVHLGSKTGFASAALVALPTGVNPDRLALSDVDVDGTLDAVALGSNSFVVITNNGSGTLSASTAVSTDGASTSLWVGNLTGDAQPDLVIGSSNPNSALSFWTSVASATGSASTTLPLSQQVTNLAAWAPDGDKALDLVAATSTAVVWLQNMSLTSHTLVGAQPTSFYGPIPNSYARGDFNEDGHQDVMISAANYGGLMLFLGDGLGYLTLASTLPLTGSGNFDVGDLNGDGHTDVAALSGSGIITTFVGDGSGNFASHTLNTTLVNPSLLQIADMNRDGLMDLVIQGQTRGPTKVTILAGDGALNFSVLTSHVASAVNPSMRVADVNEDGNLDVVTSDVQTGALTVLLGDGSGNLTTNPISGFTGYIFRLVDMNSDGHLDAVGRDATGIMVATGNGQGLFSNSEYYAYNSYSSDDVNVADFNHDGYPDVISNVWYQSTDIVCYNDQAGGCNQSYLLSASYYYLPVDLTDEGVDDLVPMGINFFGYAGVMTDINDISSGFYNYPATRSLAFSGSWARSADFNRDGYSDVVVAGHGGLVLQYASASGFAGAPVEMIGSASYGGIAIGDVNQDGWLDLAATSGNSIMIYLNTPTNPNLVLTKTLALSGAGLTAMADINHDGLLDLVVSTPTGPRLALGAAGSALFGAFSRLGTPVAAASGLAVTDVDNDGTADVLQLTSTGISAYLLAANGSVKGQVATAISNLAGGIAAGDMDGDTYPDIVGATADGLVVALSRQDGTFEPLADVSTQGAPLGSITLVDFNADGHLDAIVVKNGEIMRLLGDGSGALRPWRRLLAESGTQNGEVLVVDFNRDGRLDIGAVADGSGNLLVHYGQ